MNNCENSPEGLQKENIVTPETPNPIVRGVCEPDFLPTVTMRELYENVYRSRPFLVDGLLGTGTYLFAGAPKVGKSFLMAQLAYHVSAGIPLWEFPVRQGAVLYLALEDDYRRLQERMFRMFGTESAERLFFSVCAVGITFL